MSDLLLRDKAHAVCSELFLRVAKLSQIFAYRTRHTPCVVGCFSGSLYLLVMSDLCLQDKADAVCSELFLRVTYLCQIFDNRTKHTPCVMSCFFGSLSYVRYSLIEQGTRRV